MTTTIPVEVENQEIFVQYGMRDGAGLLWEPLHLSKKKFSITNKGRRDEIRAEHKSKGDDEPRFFTRTVIVSVTGGTEIYE